MPATTLHWTDADHALLQALVARIVHAPPPTLAPRVAARLAALPPHKQRDAQRGLRLLGSRLTALLSVGQATPFTALSPDAQDRLLQVWSTSPLPLARTVLQLVRRLVLLTHYTDPQATAAIGYLGPWHTRRTALPFEGPLATHDAAPSPVARPGDAPTASIPRPPALVLTDGATLQADVIVIGTGAGGAVAAARLAEGGRDVLIVEQGDLHLASDFTEEEGVMAERLYAEGGLRTTDDLSVGMLQGESVGGSTTINWMIMLRTPPHVLEEWTRRFGLEGMRAPELAPEFDRIEREVHAALVPDEAHSPNNRILLRGAAALGWRARSGLINARGCVRTGFCGMGCRYDAKMGTLLTYVPRAVAAGARLLPRTRAHRLVRRRGQPGTHPRWQVTLVHRAADGSTREVTAEAAQVVLAGGAVETPLLLQRSGLGGGGVGKYLRLHPTTAVVGVHDEVVYGAGGIPLSTLCDEFLERDARGYGFWLECPPMHPGIASAALPGFGEAHAQVMRRFPHLATTIALVRDGSDLDRSSGAVHLDRRGRMRLSYRLGPADADNLREAMVAAARLQLAAGAREVRTLHATPVVVRREADLAQVREASVAPNMVSLFSAHVNGTCRIGTDPSIAGADPSGQRFGASGLFVLDGSLLPTGVGVNPQETIMALSSVLSTRMLQR